MNPFIIFALVSSVIAIVYGLFLIKVVMSKSAGDEKMKEIAYLKQIPTLIKLLTEKL